jgi:hypothetical protein
MHRQTAKVLRRGISVMSIVSPFIGFFTGATRGWLVELKGGCILVRIQENRPE